MDGTAPADAVRLRAGHRDEHPPGDRGICSDQQGARAAAPLPRKQGAYRSIYQVTEPAHFANAALWAATEPRCANQAYNITNGDTFRWCNLWPRIAAVFDMPAGDVQTISLVQHMADKAPLWDRLVAGHGLKAFRYEEIVAWPFGDYVFSCDWDVMSSLTKSRQHGFHDVVDSEEMFVRLQQSL